MRARAAKAKLHLAWKLILETLDEFSRDRGELLAAALAFYTLLSMAPLIIIAVAVAGFILGEGAARAEVTQLLNDSMGKAAADTVNGWVDQASKAGEIASIVGVILVILAASRLFSVLNSALNQILNIDVFIAESFKASIKDNVRRRLIAFAMVIAAGPLLLAVFGTRALLTGLHETLFAGAPAAGVLIQITQFLFSIVVVWGLSIAVFRLVPDTRIGFRAVLRGAFLTSVLFNIGNVLVGLYLGRASVTVTYGAAASAMVVLLWLYFSAQMFLLGAEFTQVYATHFGSGLNAKEKQEVSTAEARAKVIANEQHEKDKRDPRPPIHPDKLREA